MNKPTSREVAFLALCAVHREEGVFLSHLLPPDDHLAREIAFGTERRLLTLDYIGGKLASSGALKLKLKEKMLLRMAIYQHLFMDRIPVHALAHETVELAKKQCHSLFVKFLNAALRKLVAEKWVLPEGDSANDLSIRYSFTPYFVQELLNQYGLDETRKILEALNAPPPLTVRKRFSKDAAQEITGSEIARYAEDSAFHLHSPTQFQMIAHLAKMREAAPKKVLDLCSAPGGKLIALQEFFPEAQLFANDLSESRLRRLQENLKKYQISAEVTCFRAQEYPEDQLFDLILLDVPCSNSGVLHKRAEARWRITGQQIAQLTEVQWACLQKAKKLLAPGGEIWYMTCSILEAENEKIMERAQRELALRTKNPPIKHLPYLDTHEGGFACSLTRS